MIMAFSPAVHLVLFLASQPESFDAIPEGDRRREGLRVCVWRGGGGGAQTHLVVWLSAATRAGTEAGRRARPTWQSSSRGSSLQPWKMSVLPTMLIMAATTMSASRDILVCRFLICEAKQKQSASTLVGQGRSMHPPTHLQQHHSTGNQSCP